MHMNSASLRRLLPALHRWGLPTSSLHHYSTTKDATGPSLSVPPAIPHKDAETDLTRQLKSRIVMRGGPLSLADYMQEALTNPVAGYYMRKDVFGTAGDFTTSPEISQVFGEMGQPRRLQLLEMGPGRGTLMADLLRGTSAFPEFTSALEVCMVEISPALRKLQWEALKCRPATQEELKSRTAGVQELPSRLQAPEAGIVSTPPSSSAGASDDVPLVGVSKLSNSLVSWHRSLDSVSTGLPVVAVAHELFDALPVHAFVRDAERGWLETMVDVADDDDPLHLRLVLSPGPTPATGMLVPRRLRGMPAAAADSLQAIEISAHGMATAERLAQRIGRDGGAALIIDYGKDAPFERSLVALKDHQKVELLSTPGLADISAWVDFSALRQAAETCGAPVSVHGPISQRDWLLGLGAAERLQALLEAAAGKAEQDALLSGFERIVGTGDAGMGETYRVMAITHEQTGAVPPFGQIGVSAGAD